MNATALQACTNRLQTFLHDLVRWSDDKEGSCRLVSLPLAYLEDYSLSIYGWLRVVDYIHDRIHIDLGKDMSRPLIGYCTKSTLRIRKLFWVEFWDVGLELDKRFVFECHRSGNGSTKIFCSPKQAYREPGSVQFISPYLRHDFHNESHLNTSFKNLSQHNSPELCL